MTLTVSIITLNEEKNLERTLNSVKSFADEIVIVDSGSTDKTEDIAKSFGAKFVYQKWLGYGPQRNKAIDLANSEWVLNIDADEEISEELAKEIIKIKENKTKFSVYKINFMSVCFSKKIKHGGWSNTYRIRLFKKSSGRFNENNVHEEFVTKEEIGKIKEYIYHHSYSDLADYFEKFNKYTTLGAIEYYKKKKRAGILSIVFSPIYKFLRMYILRLGFLDGLEGFILAITSSLYTMVKYYKLREIYKNNSYIKREEKMEIKRILVSRTDKIGDLVLSIPSFFMLKKMYPNAELVVLVRDYNADIVRNLSYIDRVIKIDDYTKAELLTKIEYFKADVFIALYNDSFISLLAKASKAKIKIGPISKLCSFFTYNKGIIQKRSKSIKNEGEYNLDLIEKLDSELYKKLFELNTKIELTEENRKVASLYFQENKIDGKVLVVNPFMGGSAKNISDDEYSIVLKTLLQKVENLNIIITCHISDEERAENLKRSIGSNKVFVFANGASILNTASIIERADLYFGGSTGPTHIAGALGKKIVAIYPRKNTQSPTRWGVLNNDNVKYVIPDEDNPKENYKNKYFDNFDEKWIEKTINYLVEGLQ